MRAVEAEYQCRLHKLTLTDRQTDRHSDKEKSTDDEKVLCVILSGEDDKRENKTDRTKTERQTNDGQTDRQKSDRQTDRKTKRNSPTTSRY